MSEQNPTGDLLPVIAPVVRRLTALAMTESDFRDQLRCLGEAIVKVATEPRTELIPESAPIPDEQTVAVEMVEAVPAITERNLPIHVATHPAHERRQLQRGFARAIPTTTEELPAIDGRCRLKAEAARWCAKRRRLLAEGADFYSEIKPLDQELFAKAQEMSCFLWMCDFRCSQQVIPEPYETLAKGYDTLAEALALNLLCHDKEKKPTKGFEEACRFLAEAQSALAVCVQQMDRPGDEDQGKVFYWLRDVAQTNHFFIPRYMQIDDPADPATLPDLLSRIEAMQTSLKQSRERERECRKRISPSYAVGKYFRLF